MTENHYSMLVLWSADDEAFLAHVVELPGCVAHGETREIAVQNALIAIENWIETAEELNREIPPPVDLTAFEKQTTQQARNQFEEAVQKALHQLVPEITKQFQNAISLQQQGELVSLYRGAAGLAGVLSPKAEAEDLELHKR